MKEGDGGAGATPSLTLPKGGGAIRGIGEKFAANPVTGTASMSVPIATSPGRAGFGPQLSLSYDSGSGNGSFGFGWSLALPSITRKTEQGLPRYIDSEDSDVFILSGAEDLVPVVGPDGNPDDDTTTAPAYTIRRYRPRVEGLFARIERWTRRSDGDVHWRSLSKENVLTIYGSRSESRIADPDHALKIFRWLICETRDDKGNAVLYDYKPEDGSGLDLTRASERNRGARGDGRRNTNRYVKRVHYGNRRPLLDSAGHRPRFLTDLGASQLEQAGWMFEVVFDYGEHDADTPTPVDVGPWIARGDPFSWYRAGFEVRTSRLCQRVLMFHHIPDVPGGGKGYDGLVRSTDFTYSHELDPTSTRNPVYTFLLSASQVGYRRDNGVYVQRSLPPVEFEYTQPVVQDTVEYVDAASLENLPIGVDSSQYQWIDLHGEGVAGVLTEQAGAWFYKRNLSPMSNRAVELGPLACVATMPNATVTGGPGQFMDLAGDGLLDLVVLDGAPAGFYEHDEDEGWRPFRPFTSRLDRDLQDRNLRFVDLDGDGHNDVLISEDGAFSWHPSLGEAGFDPARRVAAAIDEEHGPRLVFADGTESVHLADLSGDGLSDIVRIRNGMVCYWPNLGYGRFGAKVTMDGSPHFDNPDEFDHQRIRLADIDGSGTTDIIYLHRDGVRLYFNQSGNGWSEPHLLDVFPRVDDLVSIATTDLIGNGTASLVWSSPLPRDAGQPMRYVNLMGAQKPHLLVKTINNLGAETVVQYAPSTKFYLQDKRDGRPWITRLPFPVHVVERVETHDRISRNRFVTRYAYHHGYFDGEEREFRGFGMVEQWDTEHMSALSGDTSRPTATNDDVASDLPPTLTKTWFHTGVYLGRDRIAARVEVEYYREPGLTDAQARAMLLADTILPSAVTLDEEREACRALKGSMLRQEVYAADDTPSAVHPYTVLEQSFDVRVDQPRGRNRHAVLFPRPLEAITYHYERDPASPRVQHALTLEVDAFGNTLKTVAIGYGRRDPDASLPLQADREKQTTTLVTYTESRVTKAVDDVAGAPDAYRTPLPSETRTYELTGYTPTGAAGRFDGGDFVQVVGDSVVHRFDDEVDYEDVATGGAQRRAVEHIRTLYRRDDLRGLLPLHELESLALPGENYKLAFTPGLVTQVFQRDGQALLPNPSAVLAGRGGDRGGYVSSQELKADGSFPDTDPDDHWWLPSGRVVLSPDAGHTAAQELAFGRGHFFMPHRSRDPFDAESLVTYDAHHLLMVETRDAVGNRVTVGERRLDGSVDVSKPGNDYRVLQPTSLMDPNRNRALVTFDALGMVVGTAVMGKPEENLGDSLDGFTADLTEAVALEHLANPQGDPNVILARASTRLVYDLFAYQRTKDQPNPQPVVVYTLARETHDADLQPGEASKVQHRFSYCDGFGREIQKKIQAEPGASLSPRWVGSGWTIFNNKGKPVRTYEPFFSATHRFEFGATVGVSPVLFYDPVERVVATLHPNHSYEKVVFDAWHQTTWDANDTVLGDPRTDVDIGDFTTGYFANIAAPTWQTWHAQREHGALGADERAAGEKAALHADTPTTVHLDALGRPFLTLADNGPDPARPTQHLLFATRIELDIEGNQRTVRDAVEQAGDRQGRIVMRYAYDMLGNRIQQMSMEAGNRWTLNDASGKPVRSWDSRGHHRRTEYDPLRRPSNVHLTEPGFPSRVIGRTVYGDTSPGAAADNLRDQPARVHDEAGIVTYAYDFKGNPKQLTRQLIVASTRTAAEVDLVDWASAQPLEPGSPHTTMTSHDAQNRPVVVVTPDASKTTSTYNEAGLLSGVDVRLRGTTARTTIVEQIHYDAKGQRTSIRYGNGVRTDFDYDPNSFRLTRLVTRRGAAFPADGDPPLARPTGPGGIQNLTYVYDPVGNITNIRDDAQSTVFFRNKRIEPSCDYAYDPLYRLVEARGREHLGLAGDRRARPTGPTAIGPPPAHLADGNALARYRERYTYDEVGNITAITHHTDDASVPDWTRTFVHDGPSLIETGKRNNRLTCTRRGGMAETTCTYDAHGNATALAPQLPTLTWDHADRLVGTANQAAASSAEAVRYAYDSVGERVRKHRLGNPGGAVVRAERLYLGAFERYRELDGQGSVTLERQTLHVHAGDQRVALVETRTAGTDGSAAQLVRYQLGNHLGSVAVELDEAADLISYEEHHPYGTTALQTVRSGSLPKRYRYTGKERDEETGFSYHSARYYAPWLGRWLSADPMGVAAGSISIYVYGAGQPVRYVDEHGMKPGDTTQEIVARGNTVVTERLADEVSRTGSPMDKVKLKAGATVTPGHLGELPDFDAARKDEIDSYGLWELIPIVRTGKLAGELLWGETISGRKVDRLSHAGDIALDVAVAVALTVAGDAFKVAKGAKPGATLSKTQARSAVATKAPRPARVKPGDWSIGDLGPIDGEDATWGLTYPTTGKVVVNRLLSTDEFLATLRHELRHQKIVLGPLSGPAHRLLYKRSAAWTIGEEALAEFDATQDVLTALTFPLNKSYLTPAMFATDAAVVAGVGGAGYGAYKAVAP